MERQPRCRLPVVLEGRADLRVLPVPHPGARRIDQPEWIAEVVMRARRAAVGGEVVRARVHGPGKIEFGRSVIQLVDVVGEKVDADAPLEYVLLFSAVRQVVT